LALDLGDKRTGLATGDSTMRLACPVGAINVPIDRDGGRALLDAIAAAVDEHLDSTGRIVVGLPLNMDGSEGPRARHVRAFADRISERTGRAIDLFDERLTSAEADWRMGRSGLTRAQKKRRRDALAAAAILTGFLAAIDRPPDAAGDEPGGFR